MKQKILLAIVFCFFTCMVNGQKNAGWKTYLKGYEIEDMADAGSYLWLTNGKEVIKFDKNSGVAVDYGFEDIEMSPDYHITSIACDENGLPWIAVKDTGILKMNEDEKWIVLPPVRESTSDIIGDIIIENDAVWTWMTAPVTTLIEVDNILARYQGNMVDTYTINYNISSLAEDKDGNLWIGAMDWGGLEQHHLYKPLVKYNGQSWRTFNFSSEYGGPMTINEITFDEAGNLWMAVHFGIMGGESKLIKFHNSLWQVYDLPLDQSAINSLTIQDDNIIWVGTNRGLMKFINWQWFVYNMVNSGLPSYSVNNVVVDDDGTKWLGTESGLVAFNENGLTTSTDIYFKKMKEIELFPNPANDFIILRMPRETQKSTVDILYMQGKLIKSFSWSNDQNRLDVSHFPVGVYLVRIQWDENQILKKFVKQ